jgi:starvation-inducible outer membrane lipoprotein
VYGSFLWDTIKRFREVESGVWDDFIEKTNTQYAEVRHDDYKRWCAEQEERENTIRVFHTTAWESDETPMKDQEIPKGTAHVATELELEDC